MYSDCSFDFVVKALIFSIIGQNNSLSNESTFADYLLKNSAPNDNGLFAAGAFKLLRLLDKSIVIKRLKVKTLLDLVGIYGSRRDMMLTSLEVFDIYIF